MLHQRRNQQAPDATIAIEKRVDGFELGMHQCNLHQRRQGRGRVVMNEALDIGQQIRHPLRRRRHKRGVAGPRAANPVLRTTQFAGLLAAAANAVEQQTVGIAQQAHADRQPRRIAQIVLHQPECPQVIGHLFDIVGVADGKTGLFVEQIDQRRLRALDLGSQQGFLADGAIEQPIHRRHQPRHPGQASQSQLRRPIARLEAGGRQNRLARRQRQRDKCLNSFAQGGGSSVSAGAAHGMKGFFKRCSGY